MNSIWHLTSSVALDRSCDLITYAVWYSHDWLSKEQHALATCLWVSPGFHMSAGELEVTATAEPKCLSHVTCAPGSKESRVLGPGGSVLSVASTILTFFKNELPLILCGGTYCLASACKPLAPRASDLITLSTSCLPGFVFSGLWWGVTPFDTGHLFLMDWTSKGGIFLS